MLILIAVVEADVDFDIAINDDDYYDAISHKIRHFRNFDFNALRLV